MNKVNSIKQAVLDLNQSEGLTNLTTAKVAKLAGVSPATIYLNYQDKTDMLSRLYEEVKTELHDGLANAIGNDSVSVDIQISRMLKFSVEQFRNNPKEALFVDSLWGNQELLDATAIDFGNKTESPLKSLYKRIEESEEYVDGPSDAIGLFLSVPSLLLTRDSELSGDKLNKVIEMTIKAIKK
ncbi:TetR/AcrR family transcriptional regulator [Companilactobacillus keshanensis]|uniref:TetR/AcrR family transcriptional regulator n=1 Tax=Companilactobacillus keshanensis TaxID=2486003 RepID=A0ABW4BQF9_9LACO|nr:TetR/AcrR family transcriptional regulator [Companilactobacillus keshanensis]